MSANTDTNRPIVVAVDGSEASAEAVKWAANAALKRSQPIKLVTAYTMPQFMYADGGVPPQELYDELESEANDKIDNARALIAEFDSGIEVAHEVREAAPIDFLLELSADADMLVMGSRGLHGLSGMVMGSVSSAVVSHADCPVVVIRTDTVPSEDTKYGPIVVGVDGSEISNAAVEHAFQEASARGATLRAVHSWIDTQIHTTYVSVVGAQSSLHNQLEDHQQQVSESLKPFIERYPDVEVEEVVERGRPASCLVEAAQDAQLLVVGSHGRGGFRGMLLGSTSRDLLHAAPCPLMVVRRRG